MSPSERMQFRFLLALMAVLILPRMGVGQSLSAGDIAFVQYNADGTDDFAFVALVDIPGSEIIQFTDNEPSSLTGGEGTIEWTAPSGGVLCGTVVTIDNTPAASAGTVTETNSLNFAGGGDGIWAYQGTTGSPSYLAALGNDGATGGAITTAAEGNISGTGLTAGTDAVGLVEIDNARYDASTTSGTRAALLAAINDFNNWTGSNSVNQTYSGAFTVTDCGASPEPEMDLVGNSLSIAAGDVTPSAADHTDFGAALVSGGTVVRTFSIENSGTADLNLTDASPYVGLSGSADFSLTATPSTPISASGNTTFSITFDPSAIGTATASVSIANDDSDENPYTFDIEGEGTLPEVNFDVATDNVDEDGGTYTITVTSNAIGAHTAAISVGGGSATDGSEFTFGGPVTANFAASTTFTTTVTINDDAACAGNVNALFDLGSASGATIGSTNQLDLTIVEDDLTSGTIAFQGFETGDTWGYSVSGGAASSDNSGCNDRIFNGSNSYQRRNGSGTLTLDNGGTGIDLSSASNVQLVLYVGGDDATSSSCGNGVDGSDEVLVYVSQTATFGATPDITLNGSSNANYNIGTGGALSTTAGSPVSGTTSDGSPIGQLVIDIPDAWTALYVEVEVLSNATDEVWSIDDVEVSGDQCSTIPVCTAPTDQATGLAFSGMATTQIDGSFTAAASSPDGYLVLAYPSSGSAAAPTDGVVYTAGDPLGSEGEVVAFGTALSFSHTGLNSGTEYSFEVYSYNNLSCTGGPVYNTASPLTDVEYTLPETVSGLTVGCSSGSSMEISWTAPAGAFDGVVLALREDPSLSVHTINGTNSLYTPNTVFGSGYQFGGTTPFSYTVFNGTGTSVTVTGLTPGATYQIKAVAYVGNDVWSADATSSGVAQVQDASGGVASTASMELGISWTNPDAACFDDILVVAREASAVTAMPAGDGSAYTANAAFGSGTAVLAGQHVVYKGTGTAETVTGLTNGTEYFFTVFVRNGTEWSAGHSFSGTPNEATVLDKGDFVILAINTQALSSGSTDQICFTAFKDITPFTAIDLTDNGYERVSADEWGDTEGTVRLERKSGSSTIPAGTVICIQGFGNDSSDFRIRVSGVNDSLNWSITSLNGSSNFDLNVNDQVWFLQNGGWVNPSGSHNASYTGNILYGWTAIGWESAPNYASTSGSTVPDGLNCFSTDVTGATSPDKVKYTGPITPATQREWIGRVNDPSNWTDYSSNALYNAATRDYWGASLGSITINPGGFDAGIWEGTSNSNWFDCDNWQNLAVPDSLVSVTVSAVSANDLVVDAAAAFADGYNFVAQADTILLDRQELRIEGSGSELQAYGPFTIAGTGELLFDAVNATELELWDNWNNQRDETAVTEGIGTVRFAGGAAQDLSVQNGTEEVFHNIILDKDFQTVLSLSDDLATTATGSVTLTGGIIQTGSAVLSVRNTSTGALSGFEPLNIVAPGIYNNNAYIDGSVERVIGGAGTYDFPIGAATSGNAYNRLVLDVASGSGTVAASYNASSPGTINVNTTTSCPAVFDVVYSAMNNGYWSVDQSSGGAIAYNITVYPNDLVGISAPAVDDQYRVLKAPGGTTDWSAYALDGDPCTVSPSFAEVTGAGYSGFSDFAIGGGGTPLPVALVDLDAQPIGNHVAVEWATATEQNSAYFEVQRSANGLEWTALGHVDAAGSSTTLNRYTFNDELPLEGYSYYRLKQVDLDNSFELTEAVAVQRVFASGEIRAWPNPTSARVELAGTMDLESLEVLDAMGRVRSTSTLPQADLSALPAGIYHLRIRDAQGTRILRVQKH